MSLPPTFSLSQRDTVRLISTGRLKDPVLLPLAANHGALEDLAALESATNGRLVAQESGLPQLDPRELVFGRAGFTFINAAFAHTRPGGNRFNDDDRGAWYCAFDPEAAVGEVSYHLTRELEAVGRFENITDYAELIADFFGPFHDLREVQVDDPVLHRDPAIAYPAGQSLARQLRVDHASNGIIYPSIRHAGGTCLVCFRPDLVQNLRQGGIWRLEWQGTPKPTVTRLGQ
ncbi:RES family NAD+ phosphorylase [Bradyrhizobium sp. KB893862 SZCCT0404]|uniref:RES family NAD+ phosphorylase n=1 Tax=Bradyrhizobium sp. KB893862 SZCCT0404 TaxID=2807672 RepID=UPI001BAAEB07|nr:RES family NAD+ phosphorylase [Bradyrhizobium sp. KB893862 SZCCT0404]MBR1177079.1 RES family NAD+ phosphorylase [Bradyrhizobium sp. KB893862 SZCCT0404]